LKKAFDFQFPDAWQEIDGQTALIAAPCRALMDLVCMRKTIWQGIGWLTEGLRIEPDLLNSISREDITTLQHVYKHQRVKSFLSSFADEVTSQ
jgi:hypothetical protein